MATTRAYIIIGGILLLNLFVLYYQNGNGADGSNVARRSLERDIITRSLDFPPRFQSVYESANLEKEVVVEEERKKHESPKEEESLKGLKAWEIFDAHDCVGRAFQVYVHEPSQHLKASEQAQALQQNLLDSPYSTRDVTQACMFVYLAHVDDDLEQLPFWTRNGEGLILIYIDSQKPQSLPSNRRSFIVSPFPSQSFDLQVHTKVLNASKLAYQKLPSLYPFEKPTYLLSLMMSKPSKQLVNHFSSSMSSTIHVNFECKGKGEEEMGFCEDEEYRVQQSKSSIFTLLLPQMENFSQRFHEALLYGSIPVVLGDEKGDYLPFSDFIQWRRAALIFPPHYLSKIQDILPTIKVEQIIELRRNGRFYLESHLLDAKVLVRSILTAYRNRLGLVAPVEKSFKAQILYASHPELQQPAPSPQSHFDFKENVEFEWNWMPAQLDNQPLFKLRPLVEGAPPLANMDNWVEGHRTVNTHSEEFKQHLSGNYAEEKFTAVMVTFRRDDQLEYTLRMLDKVKFLDRIIVVWNDIQRELPPTLIPKDFNTPVFVLNATRNSLNNRFLPFDLIQTEAILNMDDDFNTDPETIEFSFRVWRENRHAVVGPNFRVGYMDKPEVGVYDGAGKCQQNMILTSGAFLHRVYHYAYTNMLNAEILEHIDQLFNCEDIAVNFLVSHLTRRPPIKTTPIYNTAGVKTKTGLHQRGNSHYEERSKCMAMFVKIFGYNPLVISEYRADSVLHGKNGPCYKTT